MKRDDGQRSAGRDPRRGDFPKEALKVAKFIVDGDSQSLKDTGRGMRRIAPARRAGRGCNHFGQSLRCRNRLAGSLSHDGARNRRGVSLFAVVAKNPGEFFRFQSLQQVRRGAALRCVESQIERAAGFEAEPAIAIGQLIGRQPQVEQHPIDMRRREVVEDRAQLGITRVFQDDVVGFTESRRGMRQHHRVSVQPDQAAIRKDLGEDCSAVARGADGSIDDDKARPQVDRGQRFA